VRWLPSGDLEFLGRADQQVKIRGFRIELGEIEAVLATHPRVREAVVLASDDGVRGKRLVACLTKAGDPSPAAQPKAGDSSPAARSIAGDPSPDAQPKAGDPSPAARSIAGDPSPDAQSNAGDPSPDAQPKAGDSSPATPSIAGDPSPDAQPKAGDSSPAAQSIAGSTAALTDEVRAYATSRLPDYMVPSTFVWLSALTLTASGKLDRKALAELPAVRASAAAGAEERFVAPRTQTEELLAAVFCQLFGLPAVGAFDDFFALGGHSLLATQVVARVRRQLGVELPIRALFEEPTVEGLARRIEARLRQEPRSADRSGSEMPATAAPGEAVSPRLVPPPLRPIPRDSGQPLPLSFAQQRLWFLDQLEPDSPLYSVPAAFRLEGPLDVAALAGALAGIVGRHEALRTRFTKAGGEPAQVIAPPAPAGTWVLPLIDLTALAAPVRQDETERLCRDQARLPFDLVQGPLVRCAVARLAAGEHAFFLAMHHIVSDGWSMGVLIRELSALYGGLLAGAPRRLPTLPLQYADYALWQRDWLRGETLERELAYWRGRLGSSPAVLDLPADRPRPAMQSYRGGLVHWALPRPLTARLDAAARELGGTRFILLMAAFQALLSRHTGAASINVGMPIAGRTRVELEGLIGFFVNTLVLRTSLGGNPTFAELVRRVRDAALEAHAHQDLPFEKLVEALEPERSLSHSPLFQVMLMLHNDPLVFSLPGLRMTPMTTHGGTAKFDLMLAMGDEGAGLQGDLEFNSDLFDAPTAARLLSQLETLLAAGLADPSRHLRELPLLDAGPRAQMLLEWNDTAAPAPWLTQHQRFSAQAARVPGRAAASFRGTDLSYAAAEERANRLAHLLAGKGVGPGVAVAVLLERSLELPVALLAILKAGGVFLPLDPAYPADRLRFMLEDSGAPVLLTEDGLAGLLPGFAGALLRREAYEEQLAGLPALPPRVELAPEDLSYLIYTSGSTGRPKGIAMTHGALANLVAFHLGRPCTTATRTLQFAPASFDVSFQEIFSTWAMGGTLVLVSDGDRRDPLKLLRILEGERIDRLFVPFIALHQLAETGERLGVRPPHLRQVITAGEQLQTTGAVAAWFRRLGDCTLENQYGPSELHVVTAEPLPLDPAGWAPLPSIGRPIPNHRLYILDPFFQPVPIGVPGEVFLCGAQIARGYLGRPDLTAERFLPDHLSAEAGGRLYRSGDLGRCLADGRVEFLGRADLQVKVRGFRIELGEIEAVLVQHPAVREGAVAAPEMGGGKRLVAYFVPAGAAPIEADLKGWLAERLPDYMVPSHFVRLDALPLGASGKVDRQALPAPATHLRESGAEFVAPRTPLEELVAEIWGEVLGADRVGIHDNFWDLGGHSLLATKVLARINEGLDIELPLRSLFKSPTVVSFTAAIGESLLGQRPDESEEGPLEVASPLEPTALPEPAR
jgi:amino acid adenylation domain-containing protein